MVTSNLVEGAWGGVYISGLAGLEEGMEVSFWMSVVMSRKTGILWKSVRQVDSSSWSNRFRSPA